MVTRVRHFLELIKFEHTLFALPFAYLGMLLAANGLPTWRQFVWITIAMAAARTLAMGTNRIVDRVLDASNPRTANRPLVSGKIKQSTAWVGTFISGIVLLTAASQLGRLPVILLPVALIFLIGYSFTKRVTWLSHFILGFTDGLAPVGAWVAIQGSLFTFRDIPAWLLLIAVTFWIGGFDIIYACQDVDFDRIVGLYAIPARFGISTALTVSSWCHVFMMLDLTILGIWLSLGWPFWINFFIISGLLIYEHRLVTPEDMTRINVAFFNINSYISVILLVGVAVSLFIS
jgi:4-hydroxybenzoate polyprenyltransferase